MTTQKTAKADEDFDICSLHERPYLGAHSLPLKADGARKAVLLIRDVKGAKVRAGKGAKEQLRAVMFFEGLEKGMVINRTAQKTLFLLFGSTMKSSLVGKKIGLYATTCRYGDGTTGPAIRIFEKRVDGIAAVGPEIAKQMDAARREEELAQRQSEANGEGYIDRPPAPEIPDVGGDL